MSAEMLPGDLLKRKAIVYVRQSTQTAERRSRWQSASIMMTKDLVEFPAVLRSA